MSNKLVSIVSIVLLLFAVGILAACVPSTPPVTEQPEAAPEPSQKPAEEPRPYPPEEPTPAPLEPAQLPSQVVEARLRESCIDFSQVPQEELGVVWNGPGLRIGQRTQEPLRLMAAGDRVGLAVHPEGLGVVFNQPALAVTVQVGAFAGQKLVVEWLDQEGNRVDAQVAPPDNEVHTLATKGDGLYAVLLTGGGFEGVLFTLCYVTTDPTPPPADQDVAEGWAPYPPDYQLPGDGQVVPGYPPMRTAVERMAPDLKEKLLAEGAQINTARAVVVEEKQPEGDLFERVAIAPVMPAAEPELACVRFDDVDQGMNFKPDFEKDGFVFHAMSSDGFRVQFLPDAEAQGLSLPGDGVDIQLPLPARRILAQVILFNPQPVRLLAFGVEDELLDEDMTPDGAEIPLFTLETFAQDPNNPARTARLEGGQWEAFLLELCVEPEATAAPQQQTSEPGRYIGLLTVESNVKDSWLPSGAYLERITSGGEGRGGTIELIAVDSGEPVLRYAYLPTAFEGEPTALPVAYIVLGSKVCRTCLNDGTCVCRTCSFWQRLLGQGMEPSQCVE